MGDEARRDACASSDLAERGLREADIGNRADCRVDELAPAERLGVDPQHSKIIERLFNDWKPRWNGDLLKLASIIELCESKQWSKDT